MQSKEFLLTPLLKCLILALAQGILGNIFVYKHLHLSQFTKYAQSQTLIFSCSPAEQNWQNWPFSSSQGPQFGLSFGRRWRVSQDPLYLEFYLPGAQESARLVHAKTKVATLVVNRYVITVPPMLNGVFAHKSKRRKRGKNTQFINGDKISYGNANIKQMIGSICEFSTRLFQNQNLVHD